MNPQDFLDAAVDLLITTRLGRPRHINLKRAESTIYYALFHCLATSNADLLVGGPRSTRSEGAWVQVYRALQHGPARSRCENQKMMTLFPPAVQDFADAFCTMQIARQEADYNPQRRFFMDEVWMDLFWAEEAVSEFLKVPRRDRLGIRRLCPTRQQKQIDAKGVVLGPAR